MVSKGEEDNMAIIKEFMRFKVHMEGSVNGHEFEIEGEGEGRPYEGTQTAKLKVTKGGPLPFAWDILSPQFMYGSKAYVKHPADIPDYLKLSFPEGFKWERVMNFEDGGVVTVTQDSSLQDGEFIYKVKLRGTNFPSDGPVMQKKTMGWEASSERMYPEDGALKGEIKQRLKLKDGGHYDAEVKTTYKAKKPVQLPGAYNVNIKLDITSHNEDYTIVEQYERAEGRHSTGGMDELYKGGGGGMSQPRPLLSPPETEEQLLAQAQQLSGYTLGELAALVGLVTPENLKRDKGWIGVLLEIWLGASAGSKPEQDFAALGVELKTIPVDSLGRPLETTFVCVAPLTGNSGVTWETSHVRHKLKRVLWIPVEGERSIPLAQRRVGSPLLWSPNEEEDRQLREDWEELMDMIVLGQVERITARHGEYLQIRPKAANAKALTEAIGARGERILTLPRGFYLKKNFTSALLARHFLIQ